MRKRSKRWGALLLAGIILLQPLLPEIYAAEETQEADVVEETVEMEETADEQEADAVEETAEMEETADAQEADAVEEAPKIEETTDDREVETPQKTNVIGGTEAGEATEGQQETEEAEDDFTVAEVQLLEFDMGQLEGSLPQDTTPPEIELRSTVNTSGEELCEEDGMFRSDGDIIITLHAWDGDEIDDEEELVTGVKEIWTWENGRKKKLHVSEEGETLFTIRSQENRELTKQYEFVAVDFAGNESEAIAYTFYMDCKEPELAVSLTGADGFVSTAESPGWYSEAIHGTGTLQIHLSTEDTSKVAAISLAETDTFAGDGMLSHITDFHQNQHAFSMEIGRDLLTGEQDRILYVQVKDEWGHSRIERIPVRIDNTKPSEEVNVHFTGTDNMLIKTVENQGTSYLLQTEQGKIYDTAEVSLVLDTKDVCQEGGTASGIAEVSFTIWNEAGECINTVQKTFALDSDSGSDIRSVQCILPLEENQEKTYQIKDLWVKDFAGNRMPIAADQLLQDEVLYILDNKAPEIMLEEPEPVLEENEKLYFNQKEKIGVTVADYNLDWEDLEQDQTSITIENSLSHLGTIEQMMKAEADHKINYQLQLQEDGIYQYNITARDILKNQSQTVMQEYIIDTTAPEVQVTYEQNGTEIHPGGRDSSFYDGTVTAKLVVTEANLRESDLSVNASGIDDMGQTVEFTVDHPWKQEGAVWTNTVTFSQDGAYSLQVAAQDMVGHVTEVVGEAFTIDTKVPEVQITFDVDEPVNGKYYHQARKATVQVKDYTFDEGSAAFELDDSGHAPKVSGWNHVAAEGCQGELHVAGCAFESEVSFQKEGSYQMKFACKDKAGHEAGAETDDFIIDMTAPQISVSFDQNAALHEQYYAVTRTATIAVEEDAFDQSLMQVTVLANGEKKAEVLSSNWYEEDHLYKAKVSFDVDGTYQLLVNGSDLAENEADSYESEVFTIDQTMPELTITGVTNYSANNGVVEPVIEYTDTNIDMEFSTVTITASNHHDAAWTGEQSDITDGKHIVYHDRQHEKEFDDMYTLTAHIVDLAGNEKEEKVVFSLNRFGSVYVISEQTETLLQRRYLNVQPQIVIMEINVDELTYKDVTISQDGNTKTLKDGKQMQVQKQGDAESWKSYSYVISPENFKKDGNYTVTLYSEDRAANTSDNRSKGKEIEFILDMTAPSIVVEGITKDGIYQAESREVTVDVQDNISLEKIVVLKNGEILKEYQQQELFDLNGIFSFTLQQEDTEQNLEFVATDLASNEKTLSFPHIYISNKTRIIQDAKTAKSDRITAETLEIMKHGRCLFAIAGAVMIMSGIVLLLYLKKKADQEMKK